MTETYFYTKYYLNLVIVQNWTLHHTLNKLNIYTPSKWELHFMELDTVDRCWEIMYNSQYPKMENMFT